MMCAHGYLTLHLFELLALFALATRPSQRERLSRVAWFVADGRALQSATIVPLLRAQQDVDARIAKLKKSFDCTEVKERAAFVCFMKDGVAGSLVRKRIEPVITSTGALFLRSVYRDRDWIYHDHVVVKIGDRELRTDAVEPTSPQMSRRNVPRTGSNLGRGRNRGNERDDYIAETVSYRGADESAIVEAIGAAGDASVAMQLLGGPRHYEKELSNDEKRLFAEAVELAQLIRARLAARE